MNGPWIPILLSSCAVLAIAAFCAVCILNPERVAGYFRERYLRSGKLAQKWPFSKMVLKSWYPTYLRAIGLIGLPLVFVWLYAVVVQLLK